MIVIFLSALLLNDFSSLSQKKKDVIPENKSRIGEEKLGIGDLRFGIRRRELAMDGGEEIKCSFQGFDTEREREREREETFSSPINTCRIINVSSFPN